jgi:tRNA(fMet)-specific endonuclease VapC
LAASDDPGIATTVVTVEEQMRGWLAVIARHRNIEQQAPYYDRLIAFIRFFSKWKLLPLQESAVSVFRDWQQARVRVATTDLKIAAIAVANHATLLSRNLRDFERVPNLHVEDWTIDNPGPTRSTRPRS